MKKNLRFGYLWTKAKSYGLRIIKSHQPLTLISYKKEYLKIIEYLISSITLILELRVVEAHL
jgi:hypothetical protein